MSDVDIESQSADVSDALANELAHDYPEKGKRSKAPFVVVAIVAIVLLFFGVRRLRAKRGTSLADGVNDISV